MDPSVNLNKEEEEKNTSIPSPPGSRLIFSLTVLSNPVLYLLCSVVGAELTSFYSRPVQKISCWELFCAEAKNKAAAHQAAYERLQGITEMSFSSAL